MGVRKTPIGAVLTGDIVNSTKLLPTEEKKLKALLETFLRGNQHEFYRGDSFQAFIKNPLEALRLALACKSLAISITKDRDEVIPAICDIRISIGIGEVVTPIKKPGEAKGEAFLLSGRNLDELLEQRLAISYSEPIPNIGFQVIADYLDSIYKGMTAKQAEVIVDLLRGTTQQQLTVTLDKSKSTISQLANAGRWPEIQKLLKQYESLLNLLL
jgi:hypothetical protein